MAFPIIPKRRSGASGNPSSLQLGELAVNTLNGELYLGADGGVTLLNGPVAAGTTVTEHTGDGTSVAFTFAGYNGTADGGYLVSVGGIDQPPSKYSVSSTAGGTITFVEAPIAGELISIRAIVAGGGGGGSGDATSLQGIAISETDPVTGQGLVYNGTEWAPGAGTANATQLQSTPVSATVPTTGQGLVYNGTSWAPATPQANATQIQGRDVANTAPTAGQVMAWNATTSKWTPTSLNGSVTFNTAGTHQWAVPAWARWLFVNATTGDGSDGFATNGADGEIGAQATTGVPPTTGANGADGTFGPGAVGKSVTVAAVSLALAGGTAGLEGLPGFGGGGSGGGSSDETGHPAAPGALGNGPAGGYGGEGASNSTSNGGGGAAGGGDATAGAAGQDGGTGGTGALGGGNGGAGGGSGFSFGNGGGGGGGNGRSGGGGGGGARMAASQAGNSGTPGKGGIADTSMCAGGAGQTFSDTVDFTSVAGTTISIVISDGAGNASITITW